MYNPKPIHVPRDVMKRWRADKSPAGVEFLKAVLDFNEYIKRSSDTDAHAAIQELYGRLTNES
jgi:hypothetical protein